MVDRLMVERNKLQARIDKTKQLTVISIIAATLALIFTLLILFLGIVRSWAGLDIFALSIIPYIMTMIFAVAAIIYGVMDNKAAEEEEEKALLAQRKENVSGFDTSEDVRFTAGRSFDNYKHYAPYVLAILGAVLIAVLLFFFWQYWRLVAATAEAMSTKGGEIKATGPNKPLLVAFVSAIFMCASVFAGAFCLGQSREKEFRWLRPVGAWLIAGFITELLAVAAALFYHFKYVGADNVIKYIMFWFFIVLGVEFIVNFISEFYRPRTIEEPRPVFESRFLALFTEPGGVMRNVADTLDYQFGFKVSGTWLYTFIEKSLVPLVIIWLVTLWLFTCIAEVGPNEIGVRERFGKVVSDQPLSPSIYFKLPYPFGKISRFPADKLQEVVIGMNEEDKDGKKIEQPKIILWAKEHYSKGSEMKFLVAVNPKDVFVQDEKNHDEELEENPVAYLYANLPVQYKIRPEQIIDYAYRNKEPKKMLKNIGEAVATEYFASVDYLKAMSTGREQVVKDIKKRLQAAANEQDLGIDIVFVNLHDAHPEVGDVAKAFQEVVGAREERQSLILEAQKYEIKIIPETRAKAYKTVLDAESYRNSTIKVGEAESERFNKQLAAYRAMPSMFKLRTYLDFLENDCKDIRKYIMSSSIPYEIYQINLEKKQTLGLGDADLSME